MAKAKKVTKTAINQMMGGAKDNVVTLRIGGEEDGIDVAVKTSLSLYERGELVRSVVDTIFNVDDEGNCGYYPYMRTFALDAHVVIYFTNLKIPSDAETACRFIECSKIVDRIAEVLPVGYLGDIAREVDELLEFKKALAAKRTKFDDLIGGVTGLIGALRQKLGSMDIGDLVKLVGEYAPELQGDLTAILSAEMKEAVTE